MLLLQSLMLLLSLPAPCIGKAEKRRRRCHVSKKHRKEKQNASIVKNKSLRIQSFNIPSYPPPFSSKETNYDLLLDFATVKSQLILEVSISCTEDIQETIISTLVCPLTFPTLWFTIILSMKAMETSSQYYISLCFKFLNTAQLSYQITD